MTYNGALLFSQLGLLQKNWGEAPVCGSSIFGITRWSSKEIGKYVAQTIDTKFYFDNNDKAFVWLILGFYFNLILKESDIRHLNRNKLIRFWRDWQLNIFYFDYCKEKKITFYDYSLFKSSHKIKYTSNINFWWVCNEL